MRKITVVSLLVALAVQCLHLIEPFDVGRQGTKGRLFLNGFTYSVALYECEESEWRNAQGIVNAEDSAVWFQWLGSESPVIADHCNQGFDIIKDCQVDDVCYIIDNGEIFAYVCVFVDPDAVNARHDMYLSTGESFMKETPPGFLYTYTCNEVGDPYHITVVVWQEIEIADWCNGSTADFDSVSVGSLPTSAASKTDIASEG